MRSSTKLVILLVLVSTQLRASSESPCFQRATTQLEMNQCAGEEFKEADSELNRIYQQVLSKYGEDADKVARIKEAEKAWVAFRDADIGVFFPESERAERGSAFLMCRTLHLARLTGERVRQLRALLEHQEGDLCSH